MTQHDLIFNRWGLGERHPTGLALAFNFAGPPGTGETICAEVIAHFLRRRLLLVRYAELESMWMGETPKNVALIFRTARDQHAVLLFDEVDAFAARRSTSVDDSSQRESNTTVSVLLQELEWYTGVVIFATNLVANFDPAFERRIRTHVMFEMPGEAERAQIWRVQLHPSTPLAAAVDFQALAQQYKVSGGDIRNAVLKAALAAAAEPVPDSRKRVHQHHFEVGIQEVIAANQVMRQSLFTDDTLVLSDSNRLPGVPTSFSSRLVTYALPCAALLVATLHSLWLCLSNIKKVDHSFVRARMRKRVAGQTRSPSFTPTTQQETGQIISELLTITNWLCCTSVGVATHCELPPPYASSHLKNNYIRPAACTNDLVKLCFEVRRRASTVSHSTISPASSTATR